MEGFFDEMNRMDRITNKNGFPSCLSCSSRQKTGCSRRYFTPTSSRSKISMAFGGIGPPGRGWAP